MTFDLHSKPTRTPGTFSRSSAGRYLIEGYIDAHETNATGAFIWKLCGSGQSIEQIAKALAAECAIEQVLALSAVEEFLVVLKELGYVEIPQ